MNTVVYEIASFMIMRNSATWRWSHARHHTDTYIVGRDPEIAVMRPPELAKADPELLRHHRRDQVLPEHAAQRRLWPECRERTFVPQSNGARCSASRSSTR
jgi:hypothetical protein